jgi:regulatory protein
MQQKLTPKQAFVKLAKYCAYQERCHDEVTDKLREYGVYGDDAQLVIAQLIEQNFLNEERFARAFAGGKFRTKKWGRVKITLELKARNISTYCIQKAMEEISDTDYLQALHQLLVAKSKTIKDKNPLIRNKKMATYLIQKGYESALVWDTILAVSKKN